MDTASRSGGAARSPAAGSIPTAVEIKNSTTPTCRVLANDIIVSTTRVRQELADIDEGARRHGVYPGFVRELRHSYGLDGDIGR